MDLTNLQKIDSAIKSTGILAILISLISAFAFLMSFIYLSNKINEAYGQAIVIDTKGMVYEANRTDLNNMRQYEYENHIKTFINLWYAYDEYNYKSNIESGLQLIGEKGKEMLNENNNNGILSILIQNSLKYNAVINDIQIDMTTLPISGSAEVTQTGYRSKNSLSRDLHIQFSLYDVARSRNNVHGCKIDEWKVTYSKSYSNDKSEN